MKSRRSFLQLLCGAALSFPFVRRLQAKPSVPFMPFPLKELPQGLKILTPAPATKSLRILGVDVDCRYNEGVSFGVIIDMQDGFWRVVDRVSFGSSNFADLAREVGRIAQNFSCDLVVHDGDNQKHLHGSFSMLLSNAGLLRHRQMNCCYSPMGSPHVVHYGYYCGRSVGKSTSLVSNTNMLYLVDKQRLHGIAGLEQARCYGDWLGPVDALALALLGGWHRTQKWPKHYQTTPADVNERAADISCQLLSMPAENREEMLGLLKHNDEVLHALVKHKLQSFVSLA